MYELLFWKYLDEVYLNHQGFMSQKRGTVQGLEELPVQFLNRIASFFKMGKSR
jgi:hypothetical protein